MAGQTPEPSFQPAGQDSGLTQGRPAWQLPPPSYTPPGGSNAGTGGGQAYAAPPPPYTPADQSYPPHDQTQTNLGQGQDYQGYQGYQQPGYQTFGAPQGQDQGAPPPPPQWQGQGAPGMQHAGARTRLKSDKGLVGSLFDFSFTSMVTPKIIKALYVLFTVWTVLAAIGIIVFFSETGGVSGTVAGLVFAGIFILMSLGVYRIILEAFMVLFQIHGELKTIREQGENQA